MSTQRALWFVASKATKKSSPQGTQAGTIYIHCKVKPGASKTREGVIFITDEAVEICVAAQAKEGEANKAVVKVLSEVSSSDLFTCTIFRHDEFCSYLHSEAAICLRFTLV